MKKFKKVEELKVRRYYQKDGFGVFLDVEGHSDKSKVFMGSDCIPPDRGTFAPVIGLFEITGNQLCCIDMPDETALKAFEHVYGMFREKYIFAFIQEDYQFGGDWFGEIEKNDFVGLKISRYKYKKFQIDFSVVMDPQKEDEIITYVYIQRKNTDYKVFCDCFNYKLSDAECKEVLKVNILKYITDFYCENVHRNYWVEGHWKNLGRAEKSKAVSTDSAVDESMDMSGGTGEIPFQ